MADNISVNVTADTTALRAQLAVAKAELAGYTSAVKAAAKDIAGSGQATAEQTVALEQNIVGQKKAQQAVAALSAQMGQGANATKTAQAAVEGATGAIKNHGAQAEAMVLVHEAMQGRFRKMAGSSMILAQRIGNISLAVQGMIATMGVAGITVAHLYEKFEKLNTAKLAAEAGALGGELSGGGFVQGMVNQIRKLKDSSIEAAQAAVVGFTQMSGVTKPVVVELAADLRALALRMNSDIPSAAHKIAEAWELDIKAGSELLQKTRASTAAVEAFTKAAQNDDAIKARSILLQELARSAREVERQTSLGTETTTKSAIAERRAAEVRRIIGPQAQMPPVWKNVVESAKTAEATEQVDRLAAAIKSIRADTKVGEGQSWSEQMRLELEKTTLDVERQGHAQGKTWQQIHQAMAQTSVDFWQNQMSQTKEGTKNREFAERQLYASMEALEAAKIHEDATAAKLALDTRLAQLSAEQAANKDNFAAVMQLEDRKLALLRGAGAAYSVQYQEELRRREDMIRQHNAALQRLDLEHLASQQEVDRQALGEMKANLDAEAADRMITRQSAITQLMAFEQEQYAVQRAALQTFIDGQHLEIAERQKALDKMAQLDAADSRSQSALRAQMAQADRQDQQRMLASYEQMFGGIESSARSAVSGMIAGSTTWQQAQARIAGSVLDSFVSVGLTLVKRWAATEVAKTFATNSGVAQRVLAEQAEGSSGWGAIVAKWVGMETAKTAATTDGVAVRTAEQTTGAMAGAAVEKSANLATIGQDAYKAAAGAYSAVAGIPYIGPFLAPVAAGVAFAAVSAFGSFDQGTNYVPQDMIAQIHAGEAIIPKYEAEKMRSGSGGGMSLTYAPTIHGARDLAGTLGGHSRELGTMLWQMSRNGNLKLPGR